MSNISLIQSLLSELLVALEPIERMRASPGEASKFLEELGWLPPTGFDSRGVMESFDISVELEIAQDVIEELFEEEPDFLNLIPMLQDATYAIVQKINAAGNPGGLPAPYDSSEFWSSFSGEMFEYLLLLHIERRLPLFAALLQFVGVITEEDVEVTATRAAYISRSIEWGNLGRLFTEPDELLRETYLWGSQPYSYDRLLRNLRRLLGTLHRLDISYPSSDVLDDYYEVSNPNRGKVRELFGPLIEGFDSHTGTDFSLDIFAIPLPTAADRGGAPIGLVLGTNVTGAIESMVEVGPFDIVIRGGFETPSGPRVEIRPDSVDVVYVGAPSTYDADLGVSLGGSEPTILFGSEMSHRVQFGSFSSQVGLKGTPADPEFTFVFALTDFEIVVQMGEGDGFLREILGTENQGASASLIVEWSSKNGLSFAGGTSLGISITLHQELGPIMLEQLDLNIGAVTGEPFSVDLGLTAGFTIGPLSVTVHRIGIKALLEEKPDGTGSFGNVDLGLGFLHPTGAGISVKTSELIGGGFLNFDPDNERYAGILELQFGEIGLVAIGLITTRMPDGSDGFSLLINIGVTFNPPIQLSFGFTLAGVGGLIAANRTMLTDVLREGLKNKTLGSILFPEDPINNASTIISDLRSVFPPEEGRFVIGPMIKLGWGSPVIIAADVGIFIELPQPIRVVVLGQIDATFPDADNVIVELHIDVMGIIEFDKKQLSIDATLYDSTIYQYILTGDAALRWSWGDNPYLAMSLGGFHPRFSPPLGFPSLRRLSLNISQSRSLQLFCWTYKALTSNSLQFGAGIELYAKDSGATVEGNVSFDALIYFNPFAFSIDMSGNLVARYRGHRLSGVYLSLNLSGPAPWHARGSATFEILAWDVSVEFNKTWGESDNQRLPAIDPWIGSDPDGIMGLRTALDLTSSWGSQLPASTNMHEALREFDETQEADSLLVHPAGKLEIRQKILPLNINLDKLGNNPVRDDHNDFTVQSLNVLIGDAVVDLQKVDLLENYSRGQYKNLTKTQRLTLPSFEKMQAGVIAGLSTVNFPRDTAVYKELKYESRLIKPDRTSMKPSAPEAAQSNWATSKFQLRGNAVGAGVLLKSGERHYATPGKSPKVTVMEEGFIVVKSSNLDPVDFDGSWPANNGMLTRTKADELMERYQKANPDENVQVLSTYEVAA